MTWQYDTMGTQGIILETDGTVVLRVSALENSTGHQDLEKNVRMMAAAPAMFEALEYIIGWNPNDWNAEKARNLAIAAIARARGPG